MEHLIKPRQKTKKKIKNELKQQQPDEFQIIILNDDYTTMSFVEQVLMSIFHKPPLEANRIMLQVHSQGRGIAGIYSWDVALTKTEEVKVEAEKHRFPLQAIVEPA